MQNPTENSPLSKLDKAGEALVIFDADSGLILFSNSIAADILNREVDDILYKDCKEVLGPFWQLNGDLINEVVIHHSIISRIIQQPSTLDSISAPRVHVQYSLVSSEMEETRWIKISFSILPDSMELFSTDIPSGVFDPIKELALSNELLTTLNSELMESQENLQSAFEAGNLGHCGINFVNGEVTLSNRGRKFFGIPEDIVVTWELLLEAVSPEYHQMVNNAFSDAIAKGQSVDSTYTITHLVSKEIRWIRVKAKVHHDATGKPAKLFGLVMDITEEKNDEQRKNDFITMVSHELKTPLTVMQAYIQILQRKLQDTPERSIQELLIKSNIQMNRMSKLINGFLNVSRLESGKLDIHPEKFDFKMLVDDVVEESHATVSSHHVYIGSVPSVWVSADRYKVQQVLNNLLSNAIKYSPVGSEVLIEAELNGKVLIAHVIDQGMGLSEDALPQVFDRFYRVESKGTENVSGFGIGLYICKEIILRHGGEIWVKSSLGKGTIFSFSIPLDRS